MRNTILVIIAFIVLLISSSLKTFAGGIDVSQHNNQNVCPNGDFEELMTANASSMPVGWSENRSTSASVIDTVPDSASGSHSLHMYSPDTSSAGANGPAMKLRHGVIKFRYKALKSYNGGRNLNLFVIGLNGVNGSELGRQGFTAPPEHVGDGQWHEAEFEFNFANKPVRCCIVAPRVNEVEGSGEGEWLIDQVQVFAIAAIADVKIANVWSDKPLAKTGENITFSAFVENRGDGDAVDVNVQLSSADGMVIAAPTKTIKTISPSDYARVDWHLSVDKPMTMQLKVAAWCAGTSSDDGDSSTYKILVIDKNKKYSRQELCTDSTGYWRILDRPTTLQQDNKNRLGVVKHKLSSEITHNTYGICTNLPRAKDYEDPFNPSHLIDGDPETCWSSQQNPSVYPGVAPWVIVNLGKETAISQINFIPYWNNSDFPLGFKIYASTDKKKWVEIIHKSNYEFISSGDKRGDKYVQPLTLDRPVEAHFIKVEFERLPISGGYYAEVSAGYKARLSGIEVFDEHGNNIALKKLGATVEASDYFLGWQNTAKTVNDSFRRIMDIGLKWVRVGQWGDQTEWAAVERVKGHFAIDAVTDKSINTLLDNGVDILYGLNYGNSLYSDMDKPWGDIGPIYQEGHPFYKNRGPRTESERQAFLRYVDFVVNRYKGRVKWWELWNEENGWFPGHEPELYGKLLVEVVREVKKVDPGAKVMFGGTAAPAPITTEIALREGGAPLVDMTAFHPYGIPKPEAGMGTMEYYQGQSVGQSPEQTGWKCLADVINGVKKPFVQHGNPNIEVWMNEWSTNVSGLGFTYNANIGEYGCAKYLSRFYIYSGWQNIPVAWWALYNMNMSQDWGIIEQKGYGLRPMSFALQNVCSVVSDVVPIKSLDYKYDGSAPEPVVISYKRTKGDHKLVLAWSADMSNEEIRSYPSTLSFTADHRPKNVELIDIYWGVNQPAEWSYENGQIVVHGLIVHDYPVAIEFD